MNRSAPRPIVEPIVELFAALSVSGAGAFAVAQAAPLAVAAATGAIAGAVALFVLARTDRPADFVGGRFSLADFLIEADEEAVLLLDDPVAPEDELLLDDPIFPNDDDELLLDDPLPRVGEESRVVRLFADIPYVGQDARVEADARLGPGEMLSRIERFLGDTRSGGSNLGENLGPTEAAPRSAREASSEASAALHAALADIRRSLRQS